MRKFILVVATLLTVFEANANDIAYGRGLVEENCARCHAVTRTDRSLHPLAPSFRSLARRYPIETLAESLAEGISTGHPDMPEFVAAPKKIDAIITYIESLDQQ